MHWSSYGQANHGLSHFSTFNPEKSCATRTQSLRLRFNGLSQPVDHTLSWSPTEVKGRGASYYLLPSATSMNCPAYALMSQEVFCNNHGCGHVFSTVEGLHYHQRSCGSSKWKINHVEKSTSNSLRDCKQQRKLALSVTCAKLHGQVGFSFQWDKVIGHQLGLVLLLAATSASSHVADSSGREAFGNCDTWWKCEAGMSVRNA